MYCEVEFALGDRAQTNQSQITIGSDQQGMGKGQTSVAELPSQVDACRATDQQWVVDRMGCGKRPHVVRGVESDTDKLDTPCRMAVLQA